MPSPEVHDLVIVGAGPAGLAAAINAESERIDTMVLDGSQQPGGQAGTSSFIENYPGFPSGISGDELMGYMIDQALRFDTEFKGPIHVNQIDRVDEGLLVRTDDPMAQFIGEAVLLSTGVEFRQLNARNLSAYLGRGVKYGSPNRHTPYNDTEVVVVGGANSAGQAAIHLSEFDACKVHILVRGKSIEDRMSGYLIDKIVQKKNIIVHTETELIGVNGNGHVDRVMVSQGGSEAEIQATEAFILIGSTPKTLWLPPEIAKDDQGFVVAGSDLSPDAREAFMEITKGRQPYAHETSMPGVFVAGDARCGTDKRVALAVGDGAQVVPELHRLRAIK